MPATVKNRMVLIAALAAWMGITAVAHAAAQDKPPPIDPALRARFGFLDPIIKKLGRGTNMLQTVQWSKGTKRHILVNNPHRARLDDLRLDQQQVHLEVISTDGDLWGLRTADIDGDGKRDILMITSRGRLVIKLRDPKAEALPEIEVGRGKIYDCLRCQDIDGDGKPDAVILTRDGLRTVTRLGKRPVVSPTTPLFTSNPRAFHLLDVNADGHLDVVICASGDTMQVHLKLGDGKAGFGPWILIGTPKLQTLFPGTGVDGATLATIHVQPRRVVEYRLKTTVGAHRPALFLDALPVTTSRAFAHGDIDDDGDLDLVLSDPQRARLTVFREVGGRFAISHTPTLAGIQCLSIGDADGDGKQDIVMTSIEEQSLAWVSGADGWDHFPKTLAKLPDIDGEPAIPVAATVSDGVTIALLRNSDKKAGLYRITGAGPEATVALLVELGHMPRDPKRLLYADLDGRHGADVAYVLPSKGLQVLFQTADGKFAKPVAASSAGFTKRMEDGALSLTGSHDQRTLLVVRERYTRTFRYDGTGQPVILSQDNGPDGIPSMALGTVLEDGSRLFLDRTNKKLYRMAPNQPTVSIELPAFTPMYLLPHGGDVLILGDSGVLRVPFGRSYELSEVRRHEPPTQKTRYYWGLAADLDGDGIRELAMLDSDLHGVHILVAAGSKLRRSLSFPIFESTNDSSREPHSMATGDVNRDGLEDLLLLAHDRILIYYQER